MLEEYQYLNLLNKIMTEGIDKDDRTGTGTRSLFGTSMRFDLSKGFPLLTTKKMFFKGCLHEILWMVSGSTNIKYLNDNGVHIWDEWADENGHLGPVYGSQWRQWKHMDYQQDKHGLYRGYTEYIDQLQQAIETIKHNPNCRRNLVTAWNPGELDQMALPPCHLLYQFNVTNGRLNCLMFQRSADMFLGVPFDIAIYALLMHMVAQVTELEVGEFVYQLGDTHIYRNHFDQVREITNRVPYNPPLLEMNPDIKYIDDFKFDDFILHNYECWPVIKAPVSV